METIQLAPAKQRMAEPLVVVVVLRARLHFPRKVSRSFLSLLLRRRRRRVPFPQGDVTRLKNKERRKRRRRRRDGAPTKTSTFRFFASQKTRRRKRRRRRRGRGCSLATTQRRVFARFESESFFTRKKEREPSSSPCV